MSSGDVTYWVVEGNVGPVATFTMNGGANVQARRIGAAPACPLKSDDSGVFNAAEFGAVDDGITNNTAAFSACLEALIAAGGGKMVLPRSRLGIYRGNIVIPPMQIWTTVEIVGGGAQPTPVILATAVTESLSLCSATDMSVLWTDCSGKASSPGRR